VPKGLSLPPPKKMDSFDEHHRRSRWPASQHRSDSREGLIEFEDCTGMKLILMQQALNLFGRSDGAIGFNTIAVKQKNRCGASDRVTAIKVPFQSQTQRREPQMPVLFSAPLLFGFNPLCMNCWKMSGGQARR
jgi:hypothetical protein